MACVLGGTGRILTGGAAYGSTMLMRIIDRRVEQAKREVRDEWMWSSSGWFGWSRKASRLLNPTQRLGYWTATA